MRESRAKTLIVIHHTIYSVYLFTRKHGKNLFLHIGVLQVFFKSIKTQILISPSRISWIVKCIDPEIRPTD